MGGGSGEIFAYVLSLSFFQIEIERSAKDSGSSFASKSLCIDKKTAVYTCCLISVPNLITKSAPMPAFIVPDYQVIPGK